MTENEKKLIEGLINQDEKVTRGFFYAQCKPMLSSVAREVFMEELNYDAIIDAFYHYLLADNGAVLRQFAGKDNKSTIFRWLRNTAKAFFLKK